MIVWKNGLLGDELMIDWDNGMLEGWKTGR